LVSVQPPYLSPRRRGKTHAPSNGTAVAVHLLPAIVRTDYAGDNRSISHGQLTMFTTVIHVVSTGSTLPVTDRFQRACALRGVRIRAMEASGQTTDFLCDFEDPSDLRRLAQEAAFYPGADQFITGWKRAFSGNGTDGGQEQ
jgi:hypothetical protein